MTFRPSLEGRGSGWVARSASCDGRARLHRSEMPVTERARAAECLDGTYPQPLPFREGRPSCPILEHPDVETPGRRMAARQAAVDDQRGAVDVARFVRGEEQRRLRDFARLAAAPKRVELADPTLLSRRAGHLVDRLRHPRLDQAGAEGVDPDSRPAELLGR